MTAISMSRRQAILGTTAAISSGAFSGSTRANGACQGPARD